MRRSKYVLGVGALVALAGSAQAADFTFGNTVIGLVLSDAAPDGNAALNRYSLHYKYNGTETPDTFAFNIVSPTSMQQVTNSGLGITSNVFTNNNLFLGVAPATNSPANATAASDSHFLYNTNTNPPLVNIGAAETSNSIKVDSLGGVSGITPKDWDFAQVVVPDATASLSFSMEALSAGTRVTDLRNTVTLPIPEPTGLSAVLAGAVLMLRRRRA